MFKRFFVLVLALCFGILNINAQTVEELIEKSLQARGDVKIAENITSMIFEAKKTMTGVSANIVYKMKADKYYFVESEAMGQKQSLGVYGDSLWQNIGGVTQVIPAEYKEQVISSITQDEKFLMGPFLKKEKNDKFEFGGTTTEDGRECYTIKLIQEGEERESYLYIDKSNFELFKLWAQTPDQNGNLMDIELSYKDFKDVNGFKFPFTIELIMGEYGTQETIIEKIEINTPIDDAVFKAPKSQESKTEQK